MTRGENKRNATEINAAVAEDRELMRRLVERTVQEVLETEMTEALGAGKGERTAGRVGYRSGYYARGLVTRVGALELQVPQDREGRFSTELFERYQRSEKALVAALAERYVQGVSTRKVKAVTEELCGHEFSASAVSAVAKRLDAELQAVMERPLQEAFPYVYVDARYEKVRETGVVRSRAVLVAIGVDAEGRRQVLGVELANRESASSWKDFLLGLKTRGLHGVVLAVSDDHPGLKRAIMEVLPEALWQRCYVHFLRNALDFLPRRAVADDCLTELRWMFERRDAGEARGDLTAWLQKWASKYPKLCAWVEANVEETWTFYRLPKEHHKHLKSTNVLERLNQEIKRRTNVVRIFPHEASCLRLVRALAVEIHEEWAEGPRYLDLSVLPPGAGCTARLAEAA
jgi:transposase-like protein